MDRESLEHIIHAFMTTKLDYCNALLYGIPSSLIDKLQRIQNIAARILTGSAKYDHITPVLHSLHWLPVQQTPKYKTLVLVYRAINKQAPGYLQELLQCHEPARSLRSSEHNLITVPFTKSSLIQARAFSVAGPRLWNSLPNALRNVPTLAKFKRELKTYLFREFYN